MKFVFAFVLVAGLLLPQGRSLAAEAPAGQEDSTVIVCAEGASALERFAAQEVRRYVYLRTGRLLPIRHTAAGCDAIVVGTRGSKPLARLARHEAAGDALQALGESDYLVRSYDAPLHRKVYLAGGSDVATLYAAYRFAELLGVRFYLDGDVIPDKTIPLALLEVDERHAPLFPLRGIQPFHDFPEGPDWWSAQGYKAIIAQLPKLRMNFFGLHTYPNAEPTVWTGLAQDVAPDGRVKAAYPTRYFNTGVTVGWGFSARKTSDYACGAAALFDQDDYAAEPMHGLTPTPATPEDAAELFNRMGALFHDAFSLAHDLGVKTCIGTETPLAVPGNLSERFAPSKTPAQDLYEGVFTRIAKTHPLDYYWLWTNEGWTWDKVKPEDAQRVVDDILAAHAAAKAVDAPFRLATCGWVLGPEYDRVLLDTRLPKDMALSCINRAVGHDPVEPAFAQIRGRNTWAIPWLEDDPAMTSVQLWVGRMRRDARDALRYGCDGLMGIHWRTRILGPNVSALAQAAWDQSGWQTESPERSGPIGGTPVDSGKVAIAGTEDDTLYQTLLAGVQGFRFKTHEGRYRVTLHFVEPLHTEPGKRRINVTIQDELRIENLDLFREAGTNRALVVSLDDVEARDGGIAVQFSGGPDGPCLAAIAVEGTGFSEKFNCGGPAYKDFQPGPAPVRPHMAALDFYRDFARQSFGPEVGDEAASILSEVDGLLPRPSTWLNGPGGYAPDARPIETIEAEYAFVDAFAALQARVEGAGNCERFAYWLENFEFLRATGRMRHALHEHQAALERAATATTDAERKRLAREVALPARQRLVAVTEEAYSHLLATVTTTGALGTVANFEGHTFPAMLDEPGAKLAALLGEALPADAQLRRDYRGPARLVVTEKRGSLVSGEALQVKAAVLDAPAEPPIRRGALHWRPLGEGSFREVALEHSARSTYRARLGGEAIPASGIEYYIEAETTGGATLRWPITAPAINQTVTILTE